MAFNSYGFLFVFLPIFVACYRGAARLGPRWLRLGVLVGAGLAFYALASLRTLPVLLASLAGNFIASRLILATEGKARARWLALAVGGNVAALVGIKYSGFLLANFAMPAASAPSLASFALPLGISFFTFQQIAFLVDTARGLTGRPRPLTYLASIVFVPTLVSGPITFFREFAPQVEGGPAAGEAGTDLTIGACQFGIGLFKKTMIADTMAFWVDPFFARAVGAPVGAGQVWAMVLGYLLLMYFDFSGYSDMALGLARMLGVRLPSNFHSPLRVTSIIDWWRRWHMSLGRFVNDYVFQSLALPLSRWGARNRLSRWGMVACGALVPSAMSMLVIGAWHGGKWTYFVFGALHGGFMVTAEAWRFWGRERRRRAARAAGPAGRSAVRSQSVWSGLLGNLGTLLVVLVALVPFRAANMATAVALWQAMIGLGPATAPNDWPGLPGAGPAVPLAELAAGLAFCWLLPNTAQLLARFEPMLDWNRWSLVSMPLVRLYWRPSLVGGLALGMVWLLALAMISRGCNSFVYFAF